MPNLRNWIEAQLKRGYSRKQIKNALIRKGYSPKAVAEVDKINLMQPYHKTYNKNPSNHISISLLAVIIIAVIGIAYFILGGNTVKEDGRAETVAPQKIYSEVNGTAVRTEGTLITSITKNSMGYIENNGYVVRVLGISNYKAGDKISLSGTYLKSIGVLASKSELIEKNIQLNGPAAADISFFAGRDLGKYVVLQNQKIGQVAQDSGILTFNVSGLIGVAERLDAVNESSMVVGSLAGYLDLLPDNAVYFRTINLVR